MSSVFLRHQYYCFIHKVRGDIFDEYSHRHRGKADTIYLDKFHSRSVCHDFRSALHDGRCGIPHANDRVSAHLLGLFDHTACCDIRRCKIEKYVAKDM